MGCRRECAGCSAKNLERARTLAVQQEMASQLDTLRAQVAGLTQAIATTVLALQGESAKTTALAPTNVSGASPGDQGDVS